MMDTDFSSKVVVRDTLSQHDPEEAPFASNEDVALNPTERASSDVGVRRGLYLVLRVLFWEPDERRRVGRPKITLKKILEDDTGLEARELQTVMLDRVSWKKNFVMSPIF